MHNVAEPIRRETAAQPRTPGIGATSPSREDRTTAPHRHSHFADDLRHRERAKANMLGALDDKIARLTSARAARLNALNKIRSALAQAILAGHATPERHENIH